MPPIAPGEPTKRPGSVLEGEPSPKIARTSSATKETRPPKECSPIRKLPQELIIMILEELPVRDVLSFMRTSKNMHGPAASVGYRSVRVDLTKRKMRKVAHTISDCIRKNTKELVLRVPGLDCAQDTVGPLLSALEGPRIQKFDLSECYLTQEHMSELRVLLEDCEPKELTEISLPLKSAKWGDVRYISPFKATIGVSGASTSSGKDLNVHINKKVQDATSLHMVPWLVRKSKGVVHLRYLNFTGGAYMHAPGAMKGFFDRMKFGSPKGIYLSSLTLTAIDLRNISESEFEPICSSSIKALYIRNCQYLGGLLRYLDISEASFETIDIDAPLGIVFDGAESHLAQILIASPAIKEFSLNVGESYRCLLENIPKWFKNAGNCTTVKLHEGMELLQEEGRLEELFICCPKVQELGFVVEIIDYLADHYDDDELKLIVLNLDNLSSRLSQFPMLETVHLYYDFYPEEHGPGKDRLELAAQMIAISLRKHGNSKIKLMKLSGRRDVWPQGDPKNVLIPTERFELCEEDGVVSVRHYAG